MLQNVYTIQAWCLAHKSEDYSVWVQHLEVYMWWQQHCRHLSLGIKWILPDVEPADIEGHFGNHIEWVKETSMYRILWKCRMDYIGASGSCIKTSTTDSSILNKSAVVERGMKILPKDKGSGQKKIQPLKLPYIGRDSDSAVL